MPYWFSKQEIMQIVDRFDADFYESLQFLILKYSAEWNLYDLELIENNSANFVFKCLSEKYENAVLKICKPDKEVGTEINALIEYNGHNNYCKICEYDVNDSVILQEQIIPGTCLRNEKSIEARLSVFINLYKNMHKAPAGANLYPTYTDWVKRAHKYIKKQKAHAELSEFMSIACDVYTKLSLDFNSKMLLHGDLHHDNILLGYDGEYKIIDPKGVVGDPIFDISRFIANEENYEISPVISVLSRDLNISESVFRKCFFVETAMSNCWNVEDGIAPDIKKVRTARELMYLDI